MRPPERRTSKRVPPRRTPTGRDYRAKLREGTPAELRSLVERQQAAIDRLEAYVEQAKDKAAERSVVRIGAGLAASRAHLPRRVVPQTREPAGWPAYRHPREPLIPFLGPGAASLHGRRIGVTAISVYGRKGRNLEQILELVCRQQRAEKNFVPVFLTDSADTEAFTRRRLAFEYFPRSIYERVDARRRKYFLIEKKWNAVSFLDLSTPINAPRDAFSRGSAADVPPEDAVDPIFLNTTAAEVELVRASGLFDEEWYLRRYPDVVLAGTDPVVHYLAIGAAQGRDPGPLFQTDYYALQMLQARTDTK